MDSEMYSTDFSILQLSGTESLLTTSQYAKVIFHNIAEKYSSDKDLDCNYSSQTDDFCAKIGDRIVLFKLGWQSVTEYELFEWAAIPQGHNKSIVVFRAENLPKDSNEFYQFCYVNAENSICGASIPFQFSPSETNMAASKRDFSLIESDMFKSISVPLNTIPEAQPETSTHSCTQCTNLKHQNDLLENTLLHFNSTLQKYDSQLSDLKKEVDTLKSSLSLTQSDVSEFKLRLQLAGDEFKKLFTEKTRIEKKYEKLVKKCQAKKNPATPQTDFDFLEELEPFPIFPYSLTHL